MTRHLQLWPDAASGLPTPIRPETPIALGLDGVVPWSVETLNQNHWIVPGVGEHLGAVLVTESSAGPVLIDGRPVAAGMHPLVHGMRLTIDGVCIGVDIGLTADEVDYHPEIHGADVYCGRTKVRLQPGERVVVCPGTHAGPCGLIYKAAAWTAGYVCPRCGFDSAAESSPAPLHRQAPEVTHDDILAHLRRRQH